MGYNLVVLMLSKSDVGIYSAFKTLAERSAGLHSLCLVNKDMFGPRFQEYITNVMMKVNLKLGGFSHSVESVRSYLAQNDIMVLGA
jgi:eukaryotic translation initiation factor 2C